MTRDDRWLLAYGLILLGIAALAQFNEWKSDTVPRWIAATFPGVFV